MSELATGGKQETENIGMESSALTCACTRIRGCKVCGKREVYEPNQITSTDPRTVRGLVVLLDYLTPEEESALLTSVDSVEWCLSQSGRRKQDYGPKINFLAKRAKFNESCRSLPRALIGPLVERLRKDLPHIMNTFVPAEMAALEYTPERGSHIDPHLDDVWAWGPRIVGVNLLGGGKMVFEKEGQAVEVSLPRRSVYLLTGESRYEWKHGIPASSIPHRRVSLTIRELTSEFVKDYPDVAVKLLTHCTEM